MAVRITDEHGLAWDVEFNINKAAEKAESRIEQMSKKISDLGKEVGREFNSSFNSKAVKESLMPIRELLATRKEAAQVTKAEAQANTAVLAEKKKKAAADAQEAKMMKDITNEYKMLNAALGDLAIKYKNLFFTGNGNTEIAKQTFKEYWALKNLLNGVDESLGNYQHKVGNYQTAFKGLGMSMQQVLRELPSLAINANTFFLAISNNLPLLFDAIAQAKKEIKAANLALKEAAAAAAAKAKADALAAGASEKAAIAAAKQAEAQALANSQAQKAPSIWKMLGSSLFSVQTLLTVGVTLLTLYGGKLVEWISAAFNGAKKIDYLKEAQAGLNKAMEESFKAAGKEIAELKSLNTILTSNKSNTDAKRGAYERVLKMYPSYKAAIEDEYKRTGQLSGIIKQLTADILNAAKARAYMNQVTELGSKWAALQLRSEGELTDAIKQRRALRATELDPKAAKTHTPGNPMNYGGAPTETVLEAAQRRDDAAVKRYAGTLQEMKSVEKAMELFANKSNSFNTGNITTDFKDPGTYAGKGKKPKADTEAKRLADNQKKIREEIAAAEAALTTRLETEGSKQLATINTKYNRMAADAREYKLSLIEIMHIEKLRSQEIDALRYSEATNKLVDSLNEQKQVYQAYEEFKLKAGKETADKLYQDQIDTSKTFLQKVQEETRALLAKQAASAFSGEALSSVEADRLNKLLAIINAAQLEETKFNQKWMEHALTDYATYEQKKIAIAENYKTQREQAIKSGNDILLAGINQAEQEELKSLQASNSEKLASMEQFADGAVYLTKKAVQQQIEILQNILDSGGLPVSVVDEVKKKIEGLNKLLNGSDSGLVSSQLDDEIKKKEAALLKLTKSSDTSSEAFKRLNDELMRLKQEKAENSITGITKALSVLSQLAPALNDLSSSLGETNNNTAKQIGGVFASLANGAGELLQTINKIETEGVSTIDAIGAAANFVISTIANIVSSAQAQKKAFEEFYLQNLAYQHDYNNALIEEIRLREGIRDSVFFTDYAGKIKAGLAAEIKAVNDYNEALLKLQDAQVITGTKKVRDWAAVAGSTAAGAGAGALIGSSGGVLSAVGAVVGGVVGFIGGMLKKRTVVNIYDNLMKQYPKLIDEQGNLNKAMAQALLTSGKIEGSSKENLQYLVSMTEQYEAAKEQIKGVISDLAGSLGNDLMSSLFDDWAQGGQNAGKAFTDGVSKSLANIGKNLLFNAVFGDDFVALQKKIKEGFKTTGDPNAMITALLDFNEEAAAKGAAFQTLLSEYQKQLKEKGVEDVFGLAGKNSDTSNTMRNSIKSQLTEETGSIIGGGIKGIQLNTMELVVVNKRMEDIATQNLNYAVQIANNTYNTVTELKTAVVELKSINNNISKNADAARAAGY